MATTDCERACELTPAAWSPSRPTTEEDDHARPRGPNQPMKSYGGLA